LVHAPYLIANYYYCISNTPFLKINSRIWYRNYQVRMQQDGIGGYGTWARGEASSSLSLVEEPSLLQAPLWGYESPSSDKVLGLGSKPPVNDSRDCPPSPNNQKVGQRDCFSRFLFFSVSLLPLWRSRLWVPVSPKYSPKYGRWKYLAPNEEYNPYHK